MKSTIIICSCALLLTIVPNGVAENPLVTTLNRMAGTKNESINGVFKPSMEGFLGEGYHGVIYYKGKLLPKKMEVKTEVAMKFTKNQQQGKNEFKMYTYLSAINKPNVVAKGVPAIYYYGMWRKHVIMAMTLLDPEFYKSNRVENFDIIDTFILFREFVRITKYMHTSGVFRHLGVMDIWFRKHEGFICDFTVAGGLSNVTPENRLSAAQKDWKEFLFSMYHFINYPTTRWSWLELNDEKRSDIRRMKNSNNFVSGLINDSKTNEPQTFNGLRKVFVEFAKYACGDRIERKTPFYDQLYQVIVKELDRYAQQQGKLAIHSWFTNMEDIRNAISAKDSISSISKIRHPFELQILEYEPVNYEFFREFDCDQADQASSSGASASTDRGKKSFNYFDD